MEVIEYRELPEFPGYRFGSDGSIWTCRRMKDWKRRATQKDKDGYCTVCVTDCMGIRKTLRVHRLVLQAFHGPCPPDATLTRHLDGSPDNNCLSNLAWGTARENEADKKAHGTLRVRRGEDVPSAKLTATNVLEIRARLARKEPFKHIASDFGVALKTIENIAYGRRWAWLTA